jgi:hypothetical protein
LSANPYHCHTGQRIRVWSGENDSAEGIDQKVIQGLVGATLLNRILPGRTSSYSPALVSALQHFVLSYTYSLILGTDLRNEGQAGVYMGAFGMESAVARSSQGGNGRQISPQRFVAYERVWTARQGTSGLGLEAQRKSIEDFATARGAEVIGRFTAVESGKI